VTGNADLMSRGPFCRFKTAKIRALSIYMGILFYIGIGLFGFLHN